MDLIKVHRYIVDIVVESRHCFQEDTLESAVSTMTNKGVMQPVLLRVKSCYYVKVDSAAIPILDCSCFAEAVEFCSASCAFTYLMYAISQICVFYMLFSNSYMKLSHRFEKVPRTLSHFTHELVCRRKYCTMNFCSIVEHLDKTLLLQVDKLLLFMNARSCLVTFFCKPYKEVQRLYSRCAGFFSIKSMSTQY